MPRYSPQFYGSPSRGYGSRGRSPPRGGYSPPPHRGYSPPPRRGYSPPPRRGYSPPPRRGYGGGGGGGRGRGRGGGGRKEQGNGSLLVRNVPMDVRPEELRVPFERFGPVRDVYIPRDYYSGEPRGFAFVEFVNADDASEAQYYMNRQFFAGREISVVLAAENRKRPEDMRRRTSRTGGGSRYGGRRSPYRRSRSRSISRSPLPPPRSGSKGGYRSRSYSPAPRRQKGPSVSPGRKHVEPSRSPRDLEKGYDKSKKSKQEVEESSPRRFSRSPSGSRSRSADVST